MSAKYAKTYKIFGKETITRNRPKNNTNHYHDEHQKLFGTEFTKSVDNVTWKEYHKATVTSTGSVTVGTKLVSESVHQDKVSSATEAKITLRSLLYKKTQNVKSAILITDDYATGYFHWLADVLPRIMAWKRIEHGIAKGEKEIIPILIPHSCYIPACEAMLTLCGINYKQECIYIPKGTKLSVERLFAIGDVAKPHGSGNYRPSLMQQLRNRMPSYINKNKGTIRHKKISRVFISRADATYRHLSNEKELIPLLEKYNFTIVEMGKLSFLQQVMLCNKADILMSLHGAGLSNMIWMKKNSKVIEIRAKGDSHNNYYFSLASALELQYFYELAQVSSSNTQKANFSVEKSRLEDVILQAIG